jgi:prepilin-type N-terminal cleavage/methylation domain-containing protein
MPRTRRAGYTLIEIAVVITMLGIMMRVAVPKVNVSKYRVDAAARVARGALQQAGRLSVQRQFDVLVVFDTVQNGINIVEDNNNNGVIDAGERIVYKALEEGTHYATPSTGIGGAVTASIVGGAVDNVDGFPAVTFHRDGASSTDLQLYLTSRSSSVGDYRGITLVQSTGRTDWYRYSGNKWVAGGL